MAHRLLESAWTMAGFGESRWGYFVWIGIGSVVLATAVARLLGRRSHLRSRVSPVAAPSSSFSAGDEFIESSVADDATTKSHDESVQNSCTCESMSVPPLNWHSEIDRILSDAVEDVAEEQCSTSSASDEFNPVRSNAHILPRSEGASGASSGSEGTDLGAVERFRSKSIIVDPLGKAKSPLLNRGRSHSFSGVVRRGRTNSAGSINPAQSVTRPKSFMSPFSPAYLNTVIFELPETSNPNAGATEKIKELLKWCKRRTVSYRNVRVTNFTTSWRDGLAFAALLHSLKPELLQFDDLSAENPQLNLDITFRLFKKLGVPKQLDPEDMFRVAVPDKLCIIRYLSHIKKTLDPVGKQPNVHVKQ